jgi:hypothetical protein
MKMIGGCLTIFYNFLYLKKTKERRRGSNTTTTQQINNKYALNHLGGGPVVRS